MTVSQARAALPELLTRVEDGEEIMITRHGRPVAVLVRPDVVRPCASSIIEESARIHELVESAARAELPSDGVMTVARAEELIGEIRADRDIR
jgi:antitoxin (DNA-binding transcriptional repressor) of toxin-antitoxin stability system